MVVSSSSGVASAVLLAKVGGRGGDWRQRISGVSPFLFRSGKSKRDDAIWEQVEGELAVREQQVLVKQLESTVQAITKAQGCSIGVGWSVQFGGGQCCC